MLLAKDINPAKSIYYSSALILDIILKDQNNKTIDVIELFSKINDSHKISFHLLILSLDWLFMIGVLNINDNGLLIKCI